MGFGSEAAARANANKMQGIASQASQVSEGIDRLISLGSTDWEGRAAGAFCNKLSDFKSSISTVMGDALEAKNEYLALAERYRREAEERARLAELERLAALGGDTESEG